jgi:hypothetical protein
MQYAFPHDVDLFLFLFTSISSLLYCVLRILIIEMLYMVLVEIRLLMHEVRKIHEAKDLKLRNWS